MFWIDGLSRQPVYEQIIEQTEKFILTEAIKAGDQMPSVRSLATTLSINPNTIQKAYNDLDRRGIIQTVPGKGCFISKDAYSLLCSDKRKKLDEFDAFVKDLALGGLDKQELIKHIEGIYSKEESTT